MNLWVTGGGVVTAQGYGRLSEGKPLALTPGEPVIPPAREIFSEPLARYGRFDTYTKMGAAAVALALRDAGLAEASEKRPIGIVAASRHESMSTDMAYYETTRLQDGVFSSPNLFSYTLPGIFMGECAVHFKLTGPTVCVGAEGSGGLEAVRCAALLMADGGADVMVAGWLDAPPEIPEVAPGAVAGACFVVLQTRPRAEGGPNIRLAYDNGRVRRDAGEEMTSLVELFGR